MQVWLVPWHSSVRVMAQSKADLEIQVRGSGPPIVMLHGWGLHSGIWAGLADSLSQQFTLHLVDLPGHGLNIDAPVPLQMDAVLDALDQLPAAGWLGWSLGGLISLQAAIRLPEKVSWLGLLAATPSFVARPHWPHGMASSVFSAFATDLAADHEQTLDRFLALEVHGARDARALLRRLQGMAASQPRPRRSALEQGLGMLLNTDLSGDLGQVNCPAAVIGGRRDRLVSPAAIEATAAGIPDAQGHLIGGAGHAPHLGHADEVSDIIHSLQGAVT